MTSASELFHNRRLRYRLRHSAGDDPVFDFSPTFHQHRRYYSSRRQRRPELDGSVFGQRRPEQDEEEIIINCDETRLPGSVLLARERLVQRLRGISVSRNSLSRGRGSSSSSSSSHQNEFHVGAMSVAASESGGLNEDELKCLESEVFSIEKRGELECCTICLEGYEDGDELIRLRCTHTFHSPCLFPWVRVCGACPNCRKPILVNRSVQ